MSAVCDVCAKGPGFGKSVSHSHVRTNRRWNPNVQVVHTRLANGNRKLSLVAARQLLGVHAATTAAIVDEAAANNELDSKSPTFVCRHCGRPMVIVLLLAPECSIRAPPRAATR